MKTFREAVEQVYGSTVQTKIAEVLVAAGLSPVESADLAKVLANKTDPEAIRASLDRKLDLDDPEAVVNAIVALVA